MVFSGCNYFWMFGEQVSQDLHIELNPITPPILTPIYSIFTTIIPFVPVLKYISPAGIFSQEVRSFSKVYKIYSLFDVYPSGGG